jgi:hypothetical protein
MCALRSTHTHTHTHIHTQVKYDYRMFDDGVCDVGKRHRRREKGRENVGLQRGDERTCFRCCSCSGLKYCLYGTNGNNVIVTRQCGVIIV